MPKEQKKYLLNHLQESVENYLLLHEEATLEELYAQFGSPDQINKDQLADTMNSMDEKQIAKKWSTARKVRLWLILVGAAVILGFLITYICMAIQAANTTITVIQDDLVVESTAHIPPFKNAFYK